MDYILFLLICLFATFSPGPAVFLAIKNSASYGFSNTIFGILGNVVAMLAMATLSIVGLGAVLVASEAIYQALKLFGGFYLIYIGVKTWRSNNTLGESKCINNIRRSKLFYEAFFVGITNPKAIIFYTALFPQFITVENSVIPQFITLALTFATMSFIALSTYAVVTNKVRVWLMKEKISKLFNRITGGAFVCFGLSLMSHEKA
ncbi:LysE family translocator [Vibrio sp. S9_S30]|uniref:LysE family translocator n=1 Tax=Vibrio sp. S9_S30 TaxID=2720226 RepID=UPI0016819CBD|nr:LysE family translocator [Vibrio sp. S9_S30]MBD1559995.1 LysE family translocator [Vibrio sp. S9_S30]